MARTKIRARAAGLTAAWLNRTGRIRNQSDPEPHIEIASLAMLKGRVPG